MDGTNDVVVIAPLERVKVAPDVYVWRRWAVRDRLMWEQFKSIERIKPQGLLEPRSTLGAHVPEVPDDQPSSRIQKPVESIAPQGQLDAWSIKPGKARAQKESDGDQKNGAPNSSRAQLHDRLSSALLDHFKSPDELGEFCLHLAKVTVRAAGDDAERIARQLIQGIAAAAELDVAISA